MPNLITNKTKGLLSKIVAPTADYLEFYTVPTTSDYTVPVLSILNTSTTSLTVTILVTKAKTRVGNPASYVLQPDEFIITVPDGYIVAHVTDYIEHDFELAPSAVLDRQGLAFDSGERFFAKASANGCVIRLSGIEA